MNDGPERSWQFGYLPVSGGRLAFHRTGGSGPPLVLVHGLTDNGLCWSRFAAAMAPDFDIIMLDARGHGLSSRSGDEAQDPGRDLAEAIDQLELARPIMVGHSVGARAAMVCAGLKPDRIARLILEDPPLLPLLSRARGDARREAFRQQVARFNSMSVAAIIAEGRAASPLWHPDDFPAWAAAKTQVDPGAMPIYERPWQDEMAGIAAPTLLIRGEQASGSLVTADQADEARSINPQIANVLVRGAGHNVRRENFSYFMAAVRRFLIGPQDVAAA